MAKITRKTALLFGITAGVDGVEEFASKTQGGSLIYSIDPADIQTSFWSLGWTPAQFEGVGAPYYQDRNGVDLVIFYQLAYLLQNGIAEWDSATTYYQDSVVQNGGGIYISLVDSNINNTPPAGASNSFWQLCAFPSSSPAQSPTRTVLTSGSGTYAPPTGCIRIFVRLVGGGGGGGGCNNAGSGSSTAGSAGGASVFGSITAGAGSGGASSGSSSVGGAGGTASGGDVNITGAPGGASLSSAGGAGGISKFGGSGSYNFQPTTKWSAASGSGSGGAGATFPSNIGGTYGSGGGAGAYAEQTIYSPNSMSYAVGASGAGGSGAGYAGGNGAAGIIIIDEFYY